MRSFRARYLPLALACLACTPAQAQRAGKAWLGFKRTTDSLYEKGQYELALESARKALELAERKAGSLHTETATSLEDLARILGELGRYAEAAPLHLRALEIREKALGPEHPDVAASLGSLGDLYRAQGEYGKASSLLERSLAIREKALGPDATVALTTATLREYQAHPERGKAEAHRRAMLRLMRAPGHPEWAHPFYWAPFVVVGEGGPGAAKR